MTARIPLIPGRTGGHRPPLQADYFRYRSWFHDLKVHMRPGGTAGRANLGDDFSAPDAIADADQVDLVMSIKHLAAAGGFNDHGISIAAFRSTLHNHAVSDGFDVGSVCRCDIRTLVESRLAVDRIVAPAHR